MLRGNGNQPSSLPYWKNGMLEKQWAYDVNTMTVDPNGAPTSSLIPNRGRYKQIRIVIRCVGCNVPGGVESLLRIFDRNNDGHLGDNSALSAVTSANSNYSSNTAPNSISSTTSSLTSSEHKNNNGFTFASNNNTNAIDSMMGIQNDIRHSITGNKKLNKIGSRLLKAAKGTYNNTTDRIERGMTGMAIRADQRKRPDWTCAGCYITTVQNNDLQQIRWEHLGDTDSISVDNTYDGDTLSNVVDNEGRGDTVFHIPIVITEDMIRKNPSNFEPVIQIKLMLRSGAGLLNLVPSGGSKSFGAGKHYTVGSANFKLSDILSPPTLINNEIRHPKVISKPIQSPVQLIHNVGQIILTVLPDAQFPLPDTVGYSLTDPQPQYCHPFQSTFHPPLQQVYAHKAKALPQQKTDTHSIEIGMERAIESTVVLPCATAVTKLLAESSSISSSHAYSLMEHMKKNHSSIATTKKDPSQALKDGYADCNIAVGAFWKFSNHTKEMNLGSCNVIVSLQKPNCIFEQSLGRGDVPIYSWTQQQTQMPPNVFPGISLPFYSKVLPPITNPGSNRIGSISFEISFDTLSEHVIDEISTTAGIGISSRSAQIFEGILNMDTYFHLTHEQRMDHIVHVPLYDRNTAATVAASASTGTQPPPLQQIGMLAVVLSLQPPSQIASDNGQYVSPDLGLLSLMGIQPSTFGGTILDVCTHQHAAASQETANNADPTQATRRHQLATMGDFVSMEWIQTHVLERSEHVKILQNRYHQYVSAISNPQYNLGNNTTEFLLPNEKKEKPSPFRPSSAKAVDIMTGIPINVHVQSIVVEKKNQLEGLSSRVYSNVTCGACADHPAKYKNGGLRRLELKRVELNEKLEQTKTTLIHAVHSYFQEQARLPRPSNDPNNVVMTPPRRHIPTNHTQIAELRASCISAEQRLAALNWECAVRRGNVLSQGVAIALTSLLSSLSNLVYSSSINEIHTKSELWKRHGYLLCFEGLLSSVGKELGMIEDASIAIEMLNMVSVQFVAGSDNDISIGTDYQDRRIPVFASNYLKWISLDRTNTASSLQQHQPPTSFILRVGLDPSFFNSRLPVPLQHGGLIRFYAVLFEMGVDIRQWGVNTSAQARLKIADATAQAGSSKNNSTTSDATAATALDDDEDDEDMDSMEQDNDILTAINMEGYRKLNLYAFSVYPQPAVHDGFSVANGISSSVHPSLGPLWDLIRSSAGKIQHGIIDAAAAATAKLSGGGVIFCKSGKDRTAMQVTLKQAQFLHAYDAISSSNEEAYREGVFEDATLMRTYGTRLAICEKNVGQPKFAFNALQIKFMPEMLKPPLSVAAGFLKGGQVFTGKGFIES